MKSSGHVTVTDRSHISVNINTIKRRLPHISHADYFSANIGLNMQGGLFE